MTRISKAAFAAALSLLALFPARAADNLAGVQSDSAKTPYFMRAVCLTGSVCIPGHILFDTAGAAFLTSTNPGFFTLSGVVPLPTGAATAAKQDTGNTSLASIAASNGSPSDAAWDGAAASASQPSLLKSLWTKLSGLLSVDTVVRSTSTDRGGTITTGGTAQQFMAANATRRGFIVQNQSSGDLYVNCLAAAAANQTSLKIPSGALYSTDPHHSGTGACSIYGATTAQAYYSREF